MDGNKPVGRFGWVAKAIADHEGIDSIIAITDDIWKITRKSHPPYVLGLMSEKRVETKHIETLLGQGHDVDFVANTPKEAIWSGEAIRCVEAENIAWGNFGDIYRATGHDTPREWVSKTRKFVIRALSQHQNVESLTAITDKIFLIERKRHAPLRIIMIHQYSMSAEDIRNARAQHGDFDEVLNTDPNGRNSKAAIDTAQSFGADILLIGPLLARLHRP